MKSAKAVSTPLVGHFEVEQEDVSYYKGGEREYGQSSLLFNSWEFDVYNGMYQI